MGRASRTVKSGSRMVILSEHAVDRERRSDWLSFAWHFEGCHKYCWGGWCSGLGKDGMRVERYLSALLGKVPIHNLYGWCVKTTSDRNSSHLTSA